MFCDRCGASLQPGQRFCGRCGKEFATAGMALAYPLPNRVQEHIRLLGILWLVLSAIDTVAGIVLWIVANTVFAHLHEMGAPPQMPAGFLQSFLSAIGAVILIKAAAGFFAGWGLLRREPWARILTIVLAFLALLHVPLGTALGIYSLWVLLPAESEKEYERASTAAGAA
jgi:hypothetical protein